MKLILATIFLLATIILTSTLASTLINEPTPMNSEAIPQTETVSLIATGDMMLGRSVNVKSHTKGFQWPFEHVQELLKGADITISNLESPLGYTCPLTNEGMIFCGDSQFAPSIKDSGIDIVNLANNHGTDQKEQGIKITKDILNSEDIAYIGSTEQPYITTIRGITIGFLGYYTVPPESTSLSWGDPDKVREEVSDLRNQVDIIIATFHWGNEYTDNLSPLQIELAHTAIDAGADIVIGHHPHWIQGSERYKGKLIYYSLGNFIFDQMWSQKTREGLILDITISKNGLDHVDPIPVVIEDYGQPRMASIEEKEQIMRDFELQN